MITYQDFLATEQTDKGRAEFVRKVINEHESSELYKTAKIADDYDRCMNTTIMTYTKQITTLTGQLVADRFSPTHRSASNFFNIFLTQLDQYLLGNGPDWQNEEIEKKLGADFDIRLQELGKAALRDGVAFGFFNYDHMEVFAVHDRQAGNFAPVYDEESGALVAGVRSWQIDPSKPLRATFYELDGYTDYMWQSKNTKPVSGEWDQIDNGCYFRPKRPYMLKIRSNEVDGTEIYAGENYPTFPIVPLWGNPHHQSEIVGIREKIDAYDMIMNGFEDDLDNAQLYWIIRGAGGMDDADLTQFLDRLRVVGAAAPADGQEVTPVEVNIPYEARERLLDRLEKQLYKDAMIMNPESLAGSAATATQIKAAYTPQNNKADEFEYCVLDFIHGILSVIGIEGETPTFTRSVITNASEEIQNVITSAEYLDREYITTKVLNLLGDGDKAEEVLKRIDAEDAERLSYTDDNSPEVTESQESTSGFQPGQEQVSMA